MTAGRLLDRLRRAAVRHLVRRWLWSLPASVHAPSLLLGAALALPLLVLLIARPTHER